MLSNVLSLYMQLLNCIFKLSNPKYWSSILHSAVSRITNMGKKIPKSITRLVPVKSWENSIISYFSFLDEDISVFINIESSLYHIFVRYYGEIILNKPRERCSVWGTAILCWWGKGFGQFSLKRCKQLWHLFRILVLYQMIEWSI